MTTINCRYVVNIANGAALPSNLEGLIPAAAPASAQEKKKRLQGRKKKKTAAAAKISRKKKKKLAQAAAQAAEKKHANFSVRKEEELAALQARVENAEAGQAKAEATASNMDVDVAAIPSSIWVGGLGSEVSKEQLEDAFKAHGWLEEVILYKRYAFVRMGSSDDAAKALAALRNVEMGGHVRPMEFARRR
ncbi:hypothetical protein EJ08DRAFT_662152 [Tothia fuscella]|uniref:RRM domain-containing protein n=1 Tax=Tothia fuscella TaxID=1048955 RepID=A0A9P4NNZ8_9PEZI|nr:hypothetical protein EJ08DRAFT_662152 [Tothia fuscella]